MEKILEVKNLKTYFYTHEGVVKAVDDVSFDLRKGEILGIVGESGGGKSVLASSILKLIPWPPGKIVGGSILYKKMNWLWPLLMRTRATHAVWRPLIALARRRHTGLRRRSGMASTPDLLSARSAGRAINHCD